MALYQGKYMPGTPQKKKKKKKEKKKNTGRIRFIILNECGNL